jgi:hypothetical protein
MTLEDARLAARRQFGGVDQVKAPYPRSTRLALLGSLIQDVPFGFRLMRKNALFSIPPPDRSRSASTRCRWRSQK